MKTILFVDDDPSVLAATRRMLHSNEEGWDARFAQGGHEALHILKTTHVDAVVTDVAMPGVTGLELLKEIASGVYGFIPVVVVTGVLERDLKRQAIVLGAQDLLCKPVDYEDLVARLRSVLALKGLHDELAFRNAQLEDIVAARTAELAASRLELVVQLAKGAELRDEETGNHIVRVAMFSRAVSVSVGMGVQECDELFLASALHDVGKIAIPDAVLRKRNSLLPEERKIMESHCLIGYKILSDREGALRGVLPSGMHIAPETPRVMSLAAEIARSHHEWWDGSGYPDGLREEEIPLSARIVAIADVMDALRSVRPYKKALSWEEAVQQIASGRITQFDPKVHDAFLDAEPELRIIDRLMRWDQPELEMEVA